jgi:flagellar FliL protein
MASDSDEKKDDAKGGGNKKLIMIVAPLVLVLILVLVYFLVLKPGGSSAAAGEAKATPSVSYVPGPVIKLEPITINLAAGHFLKLGLSLQGSASAGEEVDGAKALDAAIELFSGKTIDELSTKEGREKAKKKLVDHVGELYEHEVYDVYFTEFVMQ